MPVITVEGLALFKEQKAELVKYAMVVIIREMSAKNVGVGDCLLCDLKRTEE